MAFEVTERQRRWLTALLVLATIAVAFVVVGFVAQTMLFFGDIILVFFLAWLLAFILSPIATVFVRLIPRLPRIVAVVAVYALLLAVFLVLAVLMGQAMYRSINDFLTNGAARLGEQLPAMLAPWQDRLNQLGFRQVDLTEQGNAILQSLRGSASELVGPLQQLAVASLGILGDLLLVLILSLYMAADRDRIVSFLFRIVPPSYSDEARLLESSIARSFGGFLRGQAAMGVIYAAVAGATSYALNLDYLPVTTALAGILMAIPFFGPFVAWAPPVLVAILLNSDATVPALILMGVGWFVVMNFVQPRLMSEAVGIHPIVVLGSVLVGSKLAGVPGAIFGIPVAAVLSSFFFYYLGYGRETRTVAARAASLLGAREGRAVRLPREPVPGEDPDVDETVGTASPTLDDPDELAPSQGDEPIATGSGRSGRPG